MMLVKILCFGNPLMGNDGIGIEISRYLKEEKLPECVEVIEAGTAGLDALDLILGSDKVILVDAILSGREKGTLVKLYLKRDDIGCFKTLHSVHGIGILKVLEIGYRLYPDEMPKSIVLIGIEVDEVKEGMGIDKELIDKIPEVIKSIKEEVIDKGIPFFDAF
ncbi:MAG: hydrogenase maturation protease [Candidatus Odinarchaeota archaeon]|nr:hydrogenase maturation protease [Candidatus Odinarchaeota archaeon]